MPMAFLIQPRRTFPASRRGSLSRSFAAILLCVFAASLVTGCELFKPKDDAVVKPVERPTVPVPSYLETAERYNANAEAVSRLWARANVSSAWVDEEGREKSEHGEGHFMFIKPSRVALTAGKFGQQMLWAGANEELFYIFNLSTDPTTVYYGRYDEFGGVLMSQIAMPVNPSDLLMLIGVQALPLPTAEQGGHTEWFASDVLVETPNRRWRLLLDAQSGLPVRVDMLDRSGASVLSCKLADHEQIELGAGAGSGATSGETSGATSSSVPYIATKIRIESAERPGHLTLKLMDMTDAEGTRKLRDRAFNFNALLRGLKPDEQVELKVEP